MASPEYSSKVTLLYLSTLSVCQEGLKMSEHLPFSRVIMYGREKKYRVSTKFWWLVAKMCFNLLKDVMVTFGSLQKCNVNISTNGKNRQASK